MGPPLPHARESQGWPTRRIVREGLELRRSPGLAGICRGAIWLAEQRPVAFPQQRAAVVHGQNIRLTVARRRRICTVFPSTKSRLMSWGNARSEVRNRAAVGRRVEVDEDNSYLFANSVTRGRPAAVISTARGAWNTCSSSSL